MDLRFALRSLRRNPGFTLLAVLVMALGIGANTAVFSVVNTVLLKPLDYHDPDKIVTIVNLWRRDGRQAEISPQISAPDFHDWHDQTTAFSAMAYYNPATTSIRAGNAAEYGTVAAVTPDFFRVFDVQPAVGALLSEGGAVISYSFWQSHYGGQASALGQPLRIQDKSVTIAGVMPPRFRFPEKTDIWYLANTIFPESPGRGSHNYLVVGRLKPEFSVEQAQAEMSALASRLEQAYPNSNRGKGVLVTRMRDSLTGDVRPTLYILLGAVALVLLIACANMANLLLAKSTARVREIAIRAAVGASRWRIVRQLVTESMVLASVSGAAGLLLAMWGSNALVALAPTNVPRLAETQIDGWVLAFTLAVSIAASVLFGLAPALHASRVDLNEALKLGSGRTVGGGAGRIRAGLVVSEIALSVVLLAGAGLLIRSFSALERVALGYRPENVLVMTANAPGIGVRFHKDLLAAAMTVPGVSAAGASRVPPGRVGSNGGYWVDHDPAASELNVHATQAVFSVITGGTFGALGVPIRRGRDFDDRDDADAPMTAMINEALANKEFPGQDPIGHTVVSGFDSLKQMRVIGVVADVRQYGPQRPPSPEIFMPYLQHARAAASMSLMARTSGDPTAYYETMRRKAREISPDVPVRFTTMELRAHENVAAPRFRTLLLAVFAGLAMCLAMAGVYGVMSYAVSQRSGEIGLRMALGASAANVMALVLRQGFVLAAAGLLLGLAGAAAATRLLQNLLFEVKPGDPLTYAAVATVLTVVALAASYIPARRAAKLDPLAALRQE